MHLDTAIVPMRPDRAETSWIEKNEYDDDNNVRCVDAMMSDDERR